MFLAWLAHEVLERFWAIKARFGGRSRAVLRHIRVAGKAPEYRPLPTSTTWSDAGFRAANLARVVVPGS
jgi:hypothetical protein